MRHWHGLALSTRDSGRGTSLSNYATTPQGAGLTTTSASGTPVLTTIVLIVATVLTGLATGDITLYAHTIMPGLKKTDDRTFDAAFRAMERAILNPECMFA